MELKNKVAVVTGGSRGIGKAACRSLLEQGSKVIFCGKDRKNLEDTEKELKKYGDIKGEAAHCKQERGTKTWRIWGPSGRPPLCWENLAGGYIENSQMDPKLIDRRRGINTNLGKYRV